MIKNAKIYNTYGIKKFHVDFRLKNIQEEINIENQLISDVGNDVVSSTPLFLAKNAAGKTSFIKALDFIFRFAKKETFVKEINHYVNSYVWSINQNNFFYNKEESIFYFDSKKMANEILFRIFNEIHFSGSDDLKIDLLLTKNRKLIMEMTEDSFFVIQDNETINVRSILENISIPNDIFKKGSLEIRENISFQIKSFFNDKQLYGDDINTSSLFKGVHPQSKMDELKIKHRTSNHIKYISDNIGSEPTILLLKKLDNNIKNIEFDPKENSFDIYLKSIDSNSWPIVPSMLSFGTQKLIEILSKSISLFKKGGVMLIDEIENGLHLSIIKLLINFYTDKEINKKNAQILLTTHNPLIAERNIIDAKNVFMYENNNFINVKASLYKVRSSDIYSFVKSKNYFNDIFWSSESNENQKSSLSKLAINKIIASFSESKEWQKK